MKAFELFDTLRSQFMSTNPTSDTIELYNILRGAFISEEIDNQNHFYQLKKVPSGIALELMFFNRNFIFDISAASNRVDLWTIDINRVSKIALSSSNVNARMDIYLNGTIGQSSDLFYVVDRSDFSKLNTIRYNILKCIK